MMVLIQSLLLVTIEVACCFILLNTFLTTRESKHVRYAVLIAMILLLLVNSLYVLSTYFFARIIVNYMIFVCAMFFLFKGKKTQIIFFTLCFYGLLFAIDIGALFFLQQIFKDRFIYMLHDMLSGTILATFCKALLFLSVVIIRRFFSKSQSYQLVSSKEWVLFLFSPFITVVVILFLFIDGYSSGRVALLTSFGLIISNLFLFSFLQNLVTRSQEVQDIKVSEERAKNQLEMYQNMETYHNELRSKEHEFKNHIGCIQHLIGANQNNELNDYIRSISTEYEEFTNPYNTMNPIVDAVINRMYWKAKKEHINIIFLLDHLSDLTIKESDLVVLVSNLLNNAIEACQKLVDEKRVLHFRFTISEEQVIVASKNPVLEHIDINRDIQTTKVDTEKHGIGLKNIQKIAQKYNGDNFYSCHDLFFTNTVIFRKEDVCL